MPEKYFYKSPKKYRFILLQKIKSVILYSMPML